jgi:hypothetical protein
MGGEACPGTVHTLEIARFLFSEIRKGLNLSALPKLLNYRIEMIEESD